MSLKDTISSQEHNPFKKVNKDRAQKISTLRDNFYAFKYGKFTYSSLMELEEKEMQFRKDHPAYEILRSSLQEDLHPELLEEMLSILTDYGFFRYQFSPCLDYEDFEELVRKGICSLINHHKRLVTKILNEIHLTLEDISENTPGLFKLLYELENKLQEKNAMECLQSYALHDFDLIAYPTDAEAKLLKRKPYTNTGNHSKVTFKGQEMPKTDGVEKKIQWHFEMFPEDLIKKVCPDFSPETDLTEEMIEKITKKYIYTFDPKEKKFVPFRLDPYRMKILCAVHLCAKNDDMYVSPYKVAKILCNSKHPNKRVVAKITENLELMSHIYAWRKMGYKAPDMEEFKEYALGDPAPFDMKNVELSTFKRFRVFPDLESVPIKINGQTTYVYKLYELPRVTSLFLERKHVVNLPISAFRNSDRSDSGKHSKLESFFLDTVLPMAQKKQSKNYTHNPVIRYETIIKESELTDHKKQAIDVFEDILERSAKQHLRGIHNYFFDDSKQVCYVFKSKEELQKCLKNKDLQYIRNWIRNGVHRKISKNDTVAQAKARKIEKRHKISSEKTTGAKRPETGAKRPETGAKRPCK